MKQLVVTGAAGFIGSNLARRLNTEGLTNLILVDHFDEASKEENIRGLYYTTTIDRDEFIDWFSEHSAEVECVFHLGARTDTAEFNFRVLDSLNLSYSKALWELCTVKQIPLVYASSAATYGLGENGFSDDHKFIRQLKPLNPYGLSKQLFDTYVLDQERTPPFWCGLKFFNVYGPYEFHKGRMASVVLHAYKQIKETGRVKLFKSHHPDFKDGEQLRDFIYVDDVVEVCLFFYDRFMNPGTAGVNLSGIYNVGTGHADSFNHLAESLFRALQLPPAVDYIPTPEDIRDKYQYFTEAKMDKLKAAGFVQPFTVLEDGVRKYVNFLSKRYPSSY